MISPSQATLGFGRISPSWPAYTEVGILRIFNSAPNGESEEVGDGYTVIQD
jgi:hypothetical protein